MTEEGGPQEEGIGRARSWLAGLFVRSISSLRPSSKQDIADWLYHSKEILEGDGSKAEKAKELSRSIDGRESASLFVRGIVEAIKSYKDAPIPMSLKVAIPITAVATPVFWGQGVGVAAFGGAVGLPALLLVFLGSAGIGAILDDISRTPAGAVPLSVMILEIIARGEIARRTTAAMKEAMRAEPIRPRRAAMPVDEAETRKRLMKMDPYAFEAHVVSFFEAEGVRAWVTKKSNDMGVDGFVDGPDGLIVIQCKRYALDNLVGAPEVQQFKGVIEENEALKGYIVTTSYFSTPAQASAAKSDRVVLVDGDELIRWHREERVTR
ncbi:restriction endonuclease [Pararhodospirillum photometricum]|nr:restriction endonuclease [Pararhodospirillum photometricum]